MDKGGDCRYWSPCRTQERSAKSRPGLTPLLNTSGLKSSRLRETWNWPCGGVMAQPAANATKTKRTREKCCQGKSTPKPSEAQDIKLVLRLPGRRHWPDPACPSRLRK